jgi:hypothetical protein
LPSITAVNAPASSRKRRRGAYSAMVNAVIAKIKRGPVVVLSAKLKVKWAHPCDREQSGALDEFGLIFNYLNNSFNEGS